MTIFDPGVQPNSRNPASKRSCWRNASSGGGLVGERTPTRGMLRGCATVADGMTKMASSTMPVTMGRVIISPPNRNRVPIGITALACSLTHARRRTLAFTFGLASQRELLGSRSLFNDGIRAHQDRRWDREAKRLGG